MSRAALILSAALLAGCASPAEKTQPAPAPEQAQTKSCCEQKQQAQAKTKACCDEPTEGCCAKKEQQTAAKTKPAEPKTATGPEYVTRGPKAFADAAKYGIGLKVKDVQFQDVDGKHCSLAGLREGHDAVVVLFTSLGCPVTRNYAPTLREQLSPWLKKNVAIVFVNPSVAEELKDIKQRRDELKWTEFTVAQDPDYAWADALGARRTADTFVIDKQGVLRYRGPIDDRIGINYQRTTARKHYLADAITAVLANKPVKQPALEAPGCVLGRVRLPKTSK